MKLLPFYVFFLFNAFFLTAQAPISGEYLGYRLQVSDINLVKKKQDNLKIVCTLTNTGRYSVKLGKYRTHDTLPLIELGSALEKTSLEPYKVAIQYAIIHSDLQIEVGEIKNNNKITVDIRKVFITTPPTVRNLAAEKKAPKEVKEEKKELKKAEKAPQKTTLKEGKKEISKEEVKTEKTIKAVAKIDSLSSPAVDTSTFPTTCSDLTIDSVRVVKREDKYVTLEYTIINKGTAAANIFGEDKGKGDNVSVAFYFSGTPRFTRGAIMADGFFLTEGLKETKGFLLPNQSYTVRHRIPLEKKSPYNSVVILYADPFNALDNECDKANNTGHIVL